MVTFIKVHANLRQAFSIVLIGNRPYVSEASEVAVIKLPSYVKKHVDKLKKRDAERKLKVMEKIQRRGNTSIPVISSNKKEFNFYLGQVYNSKFPIPLMSRYWMSKKSAGQKFTINSWAPNPALPIKLEIPLGITGSENNLDSMAYYISEFSQLNLSEPVLKSISALGFEYPTPIQAMVIPKIMKDSNVLCVAETGCGKTMSYLIPIINDLVINKREAKYYSTPLALIIVPGRELAEQIAKEAYKLGNSCGIIVKALIPDGIEIEPLIPKYGDEVDLLVATFGIIHKLSSKGIFKLSHLRHLVFDEADTLLDDSFKEDMSRFFRRILVKHSGDAAEVDGNQGVQFTLSSSTVPINLASLESINDIRFEHAISPYAHRVLPHVSQQFIRVDDETRAGILLEHIKSDLKKKIPVMIFCNQSPTCDWLNLFLNENDIPNAKFHAGMTFQERAYSLKSFQTGEIDVFCCTDLASRGLDTQRAKHIVNFDFPNNTSDYILRAGRVGRVGTNQGHVTSLVLKKPGVSVVQDIEMAVRNSMKIENVDANIAKKIYKLHRSF